MGIIDRILLKRLYMEIQPTEKAFSWYGKNTLIEYSKQVDADIEEMIELGKLKKGIKLNNPRFRGVEHERITFDAYARSALDVVAILDTWRRVHRNPGYKGGVSKGSEVLMNPEFVERVYVQNDGHDRFEKPWIEIDVKSGKIVGES